MKTVRMSAASHESLFLSQQSVMIIRQSAEVVATLVRVLLFSVLLLAVLRAVFELVGSQTSSVADTVRALSQWLLVPFQQFSDQWAAISAVVSLMLIVGIMTSLTHSAEKEVA